MNGATRNPPHKKTGREVAVFESPAVILPHFPPGGQRCAQPAP